MTTSDHTPTDETAPDTAAAGPVESTADESSQTSPTENPQAGESALDEAVPDAPAADETVVDAAGAEGSDEAAPVAEPATDQAEAAGDADRVADDVAAPAAETAVAAAETAQVIESITASEGEPVAPAAEPKEAKEAAWGRVDEAGVVSVREGDDWRVVGEYPDGTPDEALAYYERKFDDLALRVRTLAQRRLRGGASASDLRSQAKKLREEVVGAAVVGDLAGLTDLLDALTASLAEASAEEAAAHRAAVDEAVAQRTAIVERVEALAARDPRSIQWKQATTELNAAFEEWQQHQKDAPRLPKATGQALWKRFRDARSTVERHRRAFFAELDETHKSARDQKTRIIERAEALAPKGEDGIPAYRALLDEWKSAGRAGRKVDDALWARFKAAGDALYSARAERDAAEQAESAPRIEARKALLEEAKVVGDTADITEARRLLTGIQRRWDEVGRIFPRDAERGLDDQLRRIEQELRGREEVDWKRNNPETKARANDATRQLEDAIEKLESELAAAQAKGDKKAEASAKEALEARRAWLKAIGG